MSGEVAFVLARLTEDEQAAQAAIDYGGRWRVDCRAHNPCYIEAEVGSITSGLARDHANHIARHDPARVLAQVTALRAVVELHTHTIKEIPTAPFNADTGEPNDPEYEVDCVLCGWVGDVPTSACPTVRALAGIWDWRASMAWKTIS